MEGRALFNYFIRTTNVYLVCLFLVLSGCTNLNTVNKPLVHWSQEIDRFDKDRIAGHRSPEMLVMVAFSGGGTRAAAFAYGALKELAEIEVITEKGIRPLLNEIDMISSVSGGSFTSTYYGLRGYQFFDEFEGRFLRKNVQGALIQQTFNPINWFRLLSSTYGASDIAARYYSKHIFDGATFADLKRPGAPLVVINATDLTNGMRFAFTQTNFDFICSDLSQYPVSRAVAASSAVPVVLSPITMKNFAGSCGYVPPAWIGKTMQDNSSIAKKFYAHEIENYFDSDKRPWLHLVDGGISDNLGLRAFYNLVAARENIQHALTGIEHPNVRQILIISVIAHASGGEKEWTLKRDHPNLAKVIGGISEIQMNRYTADTIHVVHSAYEKWTSQISTIEHPVTYNFVEVSFDKIKDDSVSKALNRIDTNFNLKDEEVDLLITSARQILRDSPELKAFINRSRELH